MIVQDYSPVGLGRRLGRWARWSLGGVAALAVLATAGVWGRSEYQLKRSWTVAPSALSLLPSPDLAAEGERAFHVFGCFGCHQEAGQVLFEAPHVGRLVAPNLSARVPLYDDAALVRLLRRGVKLDGTTAVGMPTQVLDNIADTDLAAIIAHLRRLPPRPDAVANGTEWGPLGRVGIALGKVPLSATLSDDATAPLERPAQFGAYLVSATCAECHDLDTSRDNGFGMVTPPLRAMAAGYDPGQFRHLLRTGLGIGGTDLGLMSEVARADLSHMSDSEIDAIHDYLLAE